MRALSRSTASTLLRLGANWNSMATQSLGVVQTSSTGYVLRASPAVAIDRRPRITPAGTLHQDIVEVRERLSLLCVHEHLVEALIEPVTNAPGHGALAAASEKDLHRVGQYQLLQINGRALRSRKLAFRIGATVSSRKDSWWCVRACRRCLAVERHRGSSGAVCEAVQTVS
jgi:hypothetical protein